jgi:hypothetical protein
MANCQGTLAEAAQVPQKLKPELTEHFAQAIPAPEIKNIGYCLTPEEEQQVVACFRERADCEDRLKACPQASNSFWSDFAGYALIFLAGGITAKAIWH